MSYQCIMLDFESLAKREDTVVLDLSAIVFNLFDDDKFEDLVNNQDRCFRVKFDVKDQVDNYGRKIDKSTLQWWSEQSKEAKMTLQPSAIDVGLFDGISRFNAFVGRNLDSRNALGYVRGQSFDFPIITHIASQFPDFFTDPDNFPVKFWNQRDVRTALAHDLQTPTNTKCPLPKGIFEGFIKHNSIHDCARDVISIQHAWAYKTGVKDVPEEFDFY